MAVKKLVLDCKCDPAICDHAYEKLSDLLQSGYDDGYDEGWKDAFFSIKHTLVEMGFGKARDMKLPEPPPRKETTASSRKLRSQGDGKDLVN